MVKLHLEDFECIEDAFYPELTAEEENRLFYGE